MRPLLESFSEFLENDQSSSILLGPIIGQVTQNTARIAIEFRSVGEVSCFLTSNDNTRIECRKMAEKGFPTVFKFHGLQPKTLYTVSIKGNHSLDSQFRTLREEGDQPGNLKVAVISCNAICVGEKKSPQKCLWTDLGEKVKDLDYIFHIGDQCYMDSKSEKITPYNVFGKILEKIPQEEWENLREELLEVLRNQYRRTWGHAATARVLRNAPNLMILDDHEIRDDWGWRKEDYDPNTKKCDYFYGQLARQVYYEYQRQLREDIDWNKLWQIGPEYYDLIIHGVGIVFVEYRGSRSWFREDFSKNGQLGNNQAEWVESLFQEGGKFEHVNSVLFISPLPVIFLSEKITKAIYYKIDDAQEYWIYKNKKNLAELLKMLSDWKFRKEGREITLIGGDIHMGGYTNVLYNKKFLFKQFTTSAISNPVTNKYKFFAVKFVQNALKNLTEGYSFQHFDWIRENNYGLVEVINEGEKSFVNCNLVSK